ncbi:MAG: sigma-54-dependent transcriptional regulator [Candidatus Methylomirabilales bacterium]
MMKILVVDDEEGMREFLSILLEREGFEVQCAQDGDEALRAVQKSSFDLIISDLKMPAMDGVRLLEGLQEFHAGVPVILITAYASAESAIEAMKLGAYDYLTKPFRVEDIKHVISRALEAKQDQIERILPWTVESVSGPAEGLIGRSPKMIELYKLISKVASVSGTVLISGESGTGKELVARTIHRTSDRAGKPFLTINCGAIPELLLESELFGHVKGAFTGAVANKAGLFEVADGGTVFLDEVGETSLALQVKLLRVLQDRIFRRVGGTEDIEVDVRVIAATNQNLQELIRKGHFREDLFYRLNVIPVDLPPLRERREDIPLLAMNFLAKYSEETKRTIKGVSPEAMEPLLRYDWPGNVRELENAVERGVAMESSEVLTPESLPDKLREGRPETVENGQSPLGLDAVTAKVEREMLEDALRRSGGVQVRAAKLLGISLRSFRYRAKKYGVDFKGIRHGKERDHNDQERSV